MNIKAVAKRANVSTATVSRTMNGSARVSPRTAERVRRAIDALGFYPNTNARALGSGRSSLYGLIVSDITNPFFPEIVKAFEDIAIKHGKEVLIANTNYDAERMELCVTRMLQRKVDGLAIMTSEMEERLVQVFSRRDIPLVFLDSGTPGPGISYLEIDYQAGIGAAMDHLASLGHRHIAFISGPLYLASSRSRLEAFRENIAKRKLPESPSLIQEGNYRVDGGHAAMQRILSSTKSSARPTAHPTAILTSNDLTAIGAMGAITEAGLRIPQDISIIGCDDIQLSAYTMPPLTTINLPRAEIANAAFRALINSRNPTSSKPVAGAVHTVYPTLVIRKSTGPAPKTKGTSTKAGAPPFLQLHRK
ncbi:LacI family DNA-binding transcriptional regulator [Granulicella sp. dw_53]|uniref:LacI family DNA-binding transcriptional regulator n=1 Tax=Granulicella sp. dw_53 TaxID=2719792 RepID=UPI001BD3190E|nr:LacI family DNA-binding transcriptional regulator [Granulicella sp. dw_53]